MVLCLNVNNWDNRKFWVIKEEPPDLDITRFHPFYKGSGHLHIDSLMAKPLSPLEIMPPTSKKKVQNLMIAGPVTLGTSRKLTQRAVKVMILEEVGAMTLEVDGVDGVLTPKLTREPTLINGK